MSYRVVQPPFSLQFRDMSKPELRSYQTWFLGVLPERIAELQAVVRETAAHSTWRADYTPDSLSPLGHWFRGQVETRPRSRKEMDDIRSELSFPIEIPSDELTNRTFSLAMDIGMYLGKVVETNVPGTKWDQPLKDKKFADYGQPVIVGLGPVPFNPVRIVVTIAYGIASKSERESGESLREVYGIWSGMKRKTPSN